MEENLIRILDENNNEISQEDIDLKLGYIIPDRLFKEHHEAIEAKERQFHYVVTCFYFADETKYEVEDENDPHIIKTDIYKGLFDYKALNGEEPKQVFGIDLKEEEDQPEIQAQEAWDEYEEIDRYILYTPQELIDKKNQEEKKEKQNQLLENGYDQIQNLESNMTASNAAIEDLVLVMADILGGEE